MSARIKIAVVVLVAVLAAGGILVGSYLYSQAESANELKKALIESCEDNGNPLRRIVRGLLREEVEQSKHAKLQSFFPQIDPTELEGLVREANKRRESRIAELKSVDCSTQYK